MANNQCTTFILDDDYGITPAQARRILSLSSSCDGNGALNSLSILTNSPAFPEAAELVKPYWNHGSIQVHLHLNLVEGAPVCSSSEVPLLANEHGMFNNNFLGLLIHSLGTTRKAFFDQLVCECRAQIRRFVSQFPSQQGYMQIDSHQHVHVIPLVYQALATALREEGCEVSLLREPLDPLYLYRVSCNANEKHGLHNSKNHAGAMLPQPPAINKAKVALIDLLWKRCQKNEMPWSMNEPQNAPLFCGVALSGKMDEFSKGLLGVFRQEAQQQNRNLEILFHPVSVPLEECLDPNNKPFAEACASVSRQREAERIITMNNWLQS